MMIRFVTLWEMLASWIWRPEPVLETLAEPDPEPVRQARTKGPYREEATPASDPLEEWISGWEDMQRLKGFYGYPAPPEHLEEAWRAHPKYDTRGVNG
jgi:hypothetical protein